MERIGQKDAVSHASIGSIDSFQFFQSVAKGRNTRKAERKARWANTNAKNPGRREHNF